MATTYTNIKTILQAFFTAIKGKFAPASHTHSEYLTTASIPSVVDNLTSTSTTNALSANQGRVLNDKIENNYVRNKNHEWYGMLTTNGDNNQWVLLASFKADNYEKNCIFDLKWNSNGSGASVGCTISLVNDKASFYNVEGLYSTDPLNYINGKIGYVKTNGIYYIYACNSGAWGAVFIRKGFLYSRNNPTGDFEVTFNGYKNKTKQVVGTSVPSNMVFFTESPLNNYMKIKGSPTVGDSTTPVYFAEGKATACSLPETIKVDGTNATEAGVQTMLYRTSIKSGTPTHFIARQSGVTSYGEYKYSDIFSFNNLTSALGYTPQPHFEGYKLMRAPNNIQYLGSYTFQVSENVCFLISMRGQNGEIENGLLTITGNAANNGEFQTSSAVMSNTYLADMIKVTYEILSGSKTKVRIYSVNLTGMYAAFFISPLYYFKRENLSIDGSYDNNVSSYTGTQIEVQSERRSGNSENRILLWSGQCIFNPPSTSGAEYIKKRAGLSILERNGSSEKKSFPGTNNAYYIKFPLKINVSGLSISNIDNVSIIITSVSNWCLFYGYDELTLNSGYITFNINSRYYLISSTPDHFNLEVYYYN